MKGLIAAGGTATRLEELTRVTNKHLLPVGRWPMVYYPLQLLQRVIDHRPVADRQQVLVRDARQLLETRRVAAGCDQALHAGDPTAAGAAGPLSWPRAATMPRIPAITPTAATHIHIVASP